MALLLTDFKKKLIFTFVLRPYAALAVRLSEIDSRRATEGDGKMCSWSQNDLRSSGTLSTAHRSP